MANEKRLIDANARIEEIKEAQCTGCENYGGIRCRACWVDDAIGLIDDSPTVDAVEVVRCKDCKYYWLPQGFCTHDRHDHQTMAVWQEDDDFCSYGERRTNE